MPAIIAFCGCTSLIPAPRLDKVSPDRESRTVPFPRHRVGDRTVTPSPDVVVRFRHLAIQDPENPCEHRLSNRRSSPFRGAASVTLSPRTSREVHSGEPQCPGLSRHVKPPRRRPRLSASVWPARNPPSDRQPGIGSFGSDKPLSLSGNSPAGCLIGFSGNFSIPRRENDGPACYACRHQRVSAAPTPSRTSPSGFPRSNRVEQGGHCAGQGPKPAITREAGRAGSRWYGSGIECRISA